MDKVNRQLCHFLRLAETKTFLTPVFIGYQRQKKRMNLKIVFLDLNWPKTLLIPKVKIIRESLLNSTISPHL